MKQFNIFFLSLLLSVFAFSSCGDDNDVTKEIPGGHVVDGDDSDNVSPDKGNSDVNNDGSSDEGSNNQIGNPFNGFAYGADPSWVTEMEDAGVKFYDADGKESELFELLNNVGFNSVRLRVWVDPLSPGGYSTEMKRSKAYCDAADVVVKAKRAQALGQKIMIDFHYSDNWCDPSQQRKPSSWDNVESVDELGNFAAKHTKEVLDMLKSNGVDVAWVQIANESEGGMMTSQSNKAKAETVNGYWNDNYVSIHNKCANAALSIYPDAKIVIHFSRGQSKALSFAERLKDLDIKFDILGVSLYPELDKADWYSTHIDACINNLNSIASKLNKDVMICEIGTPSISTWNGKRAIINAVIRAREEVKRCKGVFYWEPQCNSGWNGYAMGGFLSTGKPADALKVFSGNLTSDDLLPESDPNAVQSDADVLYLATVSGEELGVLTKNPDGTYSGKITFAGTDNNWPNFTVVDKDGKKYGTSDWDSQFSCVASHTSGTSRFDHFWIAPGTYTIVFDIANQKWSAVQ